MIRRRNLLCLLAIAAALLGVAQPGASIGRVPGETMQ
jgi:hypothetical protein